MKNKKGFTLIELLAVIVILGLLIAIAVPSITKYITQSRKKTLATTISKYVDAGMVSVNNGEYALTENNVIYAIPIECIPMERGGDNPFGEWNQVNDEYWAYVLVQYDPVNFSYIYGFTFKDSAGYGMLPISHDVMNVKGKDINTNLDISKPTTGLYSYFSGADNWEHSGFKINSDTRVKVIQSKLEGDVGDGRNTCTLQNKGLNYEEIEEIKSRPGTLINSSNDETLVFGKELERTKIEEIYTLSVIDIPTDAIESWDASIQKNESIMAWTMDRDKDGMYELYVGQSNGVIAPSNSGNLFAKFSNVKVMDLSNLDTSNVTIMSSMFEGLISLTKLNISNFDTSEVTSMWHMFANCNSLIKLDVSSFDTSKVKNIEYMFYEMHSLTSLNLNHFDTSNVTSMHRVFAGCNSLKTLKIDNFDTSKVTTMQSMFLDCNSLTSLNVSSFDTTNVTNMTGMFSGLKLVTSLDVSSFSTENVTNMSYMFSDMISLASLDVSNFNTSNVTTMGNMFAGCKSLTNLNLSNFNTENVTNMGGMFNYSENLISVDISSFNTTNVTKMSWMFAGTKISNLDLNHFDTKNVTDMAFMFYGCGEFSDLDLSSFYTDNLTKTNHMFTFARNLANLDIRNFDFSSVTSYDEMLSWIPETSKIIVKDDTARNWIQTNIGSGYTNIVTVNEL